MVSKRPTCFKTKLRETHRCIIQVKVGLLDALAMVSLGIGQTEQPLFKERTSNSQHCAANTGL